nr:MAG TPA: hypothetical protein [Caudoviricetes sp.]
MNYCIVEDGVIVNMIVAEADFAAEIGAPSYPGSAPISAAIGGAYTPPAPAPAPPPTEPNLAVIPWQRPDLCGDWRGLHAPGPGAGAAPHGTKPGP